MVLWGFISIYCAGTSNTFGENSFVVKEKFDKNKSIAQQNIEVVDGFCLLNQDNYETIEPLALSMGGHLTNSDADIAISENGGQLFVVPYFGQKYTVGYAEKGGCTVGTEDIDANNTRSLLVKNLSLQEIYREESLSQISEWYSVEKPGRFAGSMIIFTYPKEEVKSKTGSIAFMPASVVSSLQ